MRSPNYPQLSLPEAMNKAQELYAKIHISKASPEKIAERLGYKSLNGRSLGVISALKKYGLIAGRGDEVGVTHDAVIMFERPDSHPEKREAVRNAALSPPLFNDIYERFNGQMPERGDLRVYLSGMGFSRVAIDEITRNYEETMQLVSPASEDYTPRATSSMFEEPDMSSQPLAQSLPQRTIVSAPLPSHADQQASDDEGKVKRWSWPLSFQRNIEAVVSIRGEKLRRRDLEILEKKVRDLIDAWEDEEDTTTSSDLS